MRRYVRYGVIALLGAAAALALALLGIAFVMDGDEGFDVEPIRLIGEYSVDGGAWESIASFDGFTRNERHIVVFCGRFECGFEAGELLLLRVQNLRVRMMINGEDAFAFGHGGAAFTRSAGDAWVGYATDGVTPEDEIVLAVETVYRHDAVGALNRFFYNMRTGSERSLLREMTALHRTAFLAGFLLTAFGAVMMLASVVGLCLRLSYARSTLLFGAFSLAGGVWTFLNFDYITLLYARPVFLALLAHFALLSIPIVCALYVRTFVTEKRRFPPLLTALACTAYMLTAGILQACGVLDLAETTDVFLALAAACILVCGATLCRERRASGSRTARLTFLSMLPAFVGALLDMANYHLGLYAQGTGFQLGLLFFVVMQIGILLTALQENAKRTLKLENDLLQSRVTMMLSQIQPHFLFNSLTAIKQLCAVDPERAEECIGSFASYLRINLDSLGRSAIIPLTRELNHTEQYLKLEQMRFGERVRVQYDLRYKGFSLPSLTVQPIVENAVRYGITKRPEGGTVTIFADEADDAYIVRVSDDGVGFDTTKPLSDDRSHIGIENVRSRLSSLCGGELTIESEPGRGTSVIIRIPKREASEE